MSEAGPSSNPKQQNNLAEPHGSRKLSGHLSAAVAGAGAGVGSSEIGVERAGEKPKRRGAFSGHKTSGHSHGASKKSRDRTKHLKLSAPVSKPVVQGDARGKASRRRSKHHHRILIRRHRRRPGSRRHHKQRPRAESHHLLTTARISSSVSSHVSTHERSLGHMQFKTTDSPLLPDGPIPGSIARHLTNSAPPQALSQANSTTPNRPSGTAASPSNYLLLVGLPLYACLMFALILCLVIKYCKNAKRAFKAKSCPESNKKSPNKIKRFLTSPIGLISNGKIFNQSKEPNTSEVVKSKFVLGTGAAVMGEQKKSLDCHQLTINMEGSELSTEDSDGPQSQDGANGSADPRAKPAKHKGKPMYLGRLKYSLEYDFNRCLLSVCIHEAHELAAMDQNGFSDPYVNVYMANNKNYPTYRTKIHKRTLNPKFNETFTFQISYVELTKQTLILSVYDYDKLTRHDEIGQLTLPMNSIDLAQRQVNCSELRKMNDANEGRLGDICLSLRYVPTAGRLNVVVLEARQLKKMDVAGLSDPYVKLALFSQGKRLKKKKTSIKKCTLNPHFNESFSFEVPFDQAQKVQLVVTVVDYDRIGTSEPIGTITLGCEQATSETEQRHWMDMLSSPRRPIARWHALRGIEFDPKRPVLSRRLSKLISN